MKTLKQRLQKLLNENGITPYKLSLKTGISQPTLSRILNKEVTPNSNTTQAICKYFNVSESWLLTGKEGVTPIDYTKGTFLDDETEKILHKIPKQDIIAYIRRYKSEFENLEIYKLFIELETKDGIIEELLKRI